MTADHRPPTPDEITEKLGPKNVDWQYLTLLRDILDNGIISPDRTGTGTKKVFGRMMKFDLQKDYPLLTTKEVWFKGVKEELLWFIRGETNIRPLVLKGVNIWNPWPLKRYLESKGKGHIHPKHTPELWEEEMQKFILRIIKDEEFASKEGELGPIYGYKWRHWKTRDGGEIDQLASAIKILKTQSHSRRIEVTSWDPADINKAILPPCHMEFQFDVRGNKLDCAMKQRSVDTFIGLPFNIASYALLTEIVAQITNLEPGELTIFLGDTHLYLDHLDQAHLQLTREPRSLPKLIINPPITDIDNISSKSIRIEGYSPHPHISAPIAI